MSSVATETTSEAPGAPVSAPQVLDVESLLAPISSDQPAGENLQYSAQYDEIKEARRAEDDLPQGDWEREAKTAEWHKVLELSTSALLNQTKDLQICAWMIEAVVKTSGFAGFRDGLKVLRGLHEHFWENLYPENDEGDVEARANALSWLNSNIVIPLKQLPLTKSGTGIDYSFLQWEDSVKFDIPENLESLGQEAYNRAMELKSQAEAEGRTSGEAWRKAKGGTRRAFYEELFLTVNECWEECRALDTVMDEKFGRQTPGLQSLKKALDEIRTLIEKLVKEKRILEPDPVNNGVAAGVSSASVDGSAGAVGPVRSREDALRRLAEVAQYFQRTEPHSPVAYLVQRAIKWGQMPLELWLEDVIRDGAVLGQIRETLGIGTEMPDLGGGNDAGLE